MPAPPAVLSFPDRGASWSTGPRTSEGAAAHEWTGGSGACEEKLALEATVQGFSAPAGSQASVALLLGALRCSLSRHFSLLLCSGNLRRLEGGTSRTVANEVRGGGRLANGSALLRDSGFFGGWVGAGVWRARAG